MENDPISLDSVAINGAPSYTYPVIANQIFKKFGIKKGIGIDVGTGSGSLSIAMARITKLEIYAMDISPDMYHKVMENVKINFLKDRIVPQLGDVNQMPFPDHFADLVFSRGSMFFWKDLTLAFREIYRVLKPGGAGYIGGGFGSASIKKKVKKQFKNNKNGSYKTPPKISIKTLEIAVITAGISDYTIINDESGLWVLFKKSID